MVPASPSRPEAIELIGGHPALDLVNTVSWRHDVERRRENLVLPADLLAWGERVLALDEPVVAAMRSAMTADPDTAQRVLREAHELREALYEHLVDCLDADHLEAPPPQVEPGCALHRAFIDALTASSLGGTPARWEVTPRCPLGLTRVLALHALALLETMSRERLRRCQDDGCGWLFLDTTRNHSRRWCSSGDCGNRHRARRHYARARARAG